MLHAPFLHLHGAWTQDVHVVIQHDCLCVQVNAYDLVGALDMLAQLESEQTGQRKHLLQVSLTTGRHVLLHAFTPVLKPVCLFKPSV